jgi:hypothetical protein
MSVEACDNSWDRTDFIQLTKAANMLRDPIKRRLYDLMCCTSCNRMCDHPAADLLCETCVYPVHRNHAVGTPGIINFKTRAEVILQGAKCNQCTSSSRVRFIGPCCYTEVRSLHFMEEEVRECHAKDYQIAFSDACTRLDKRLREQQTKVSSRLRAAYLYTMAYYR